ncbi:MAG: Mur ligase domain-containing protein [Myxococcota bacterium]
MARVHLIGICGTGMGSFAGLLKEAGHVVRGSDQATYPPMSDKLREWGIEVRTPYVVENLEPSPDLVIVGNAIRRENPEASAVRTSGIESASFPEALSRFFLEDRTSIVVAGTHGKTTTTSMIAHLLHRTGQDPSFLIGGVPENFGVGFRHGKGPHFVVEGDEYDTAYFDKRPKFLHYRPKILVLTSLEFDHADIYPDLAAIEARFEELVALVPKDGLILAAADAQLPLGRAVAPVRRYGQGGEASPSDLVLDGEGARFRLRGLEHRLALGGAFNVDNACAALEVVQHLGVGSEDAAAALADFRGVARRQTLRAEVAGIRIVDDFAHHPTAVRLTLEGLRSRFSGPLIAVFEPRTATSARSFFQDDYARSFDAADEVIIAGVGRTELPEAERLDVERLAADIDHRGTPACAIHRVEDIVARLASSAPSGATIAFMSNGGFGGIHDRMEAALRARPQ